MFFDRCSLQRLKRPPTLHPNLAALYRRKVENLHEALNDQYHHIEAAEILRSIIERINVRPLERGVFEIDLVGEIVNMVDLAQTAVQTKTAASNEATVPDVYRSSVKVVAGARNQLYLLLTTDDLSKTSMSLHHHNGSNDGNNGNDGMDQRRLKPVRRARAFAYGGCG